MPATSTYYALTSEIVSGDTLWVFFELFRTGIIIGLSAGLLIRATSWIWK